MTEEINFLTLQTRFKEIKEYYSTENYKYIHVRTIDNFLFHADYFFMKHHKDEIYKTLTQYFDIISSKQIDNITESLELFNKYIKPLTNLFIDLRDFHLAPRVWIILLWTLLAFVALFLVKASIYFYIGLLVLTILFIARQLYYSNQKKTYGFMH